jgi:HYDIN/CFA65/VesB-like, Ig-like domain
MKGKACGILIAVAAVCFLPVFGQSGASPPAQTNLLSAAGQSGPVIVVSPNALNFGLVGAGRTKQLTLTLRNAGPGTLSGTATVAAPFSLSGNAYWLQSGQSQTIAVRYQPMAEGSDSGTVAFTGGRGAAVTVTGTARTPPRPPGHLRVNHKASSHFEEEDNADFIVRYYSDSTSYILKPAMRDGPYWSVCNRALALKVAGQQPRHELAVVVLIHYPNSVTEVPAKQAWLKDLAALGYRRVVFLRGLNKIKVKGLTILPDPPPPAGSRGN